MTITVSQISNTQSFGTWLQRTNDIAYIISTNVVTTDSTLGGSITTGRGFVNGNFGANTIHVTTITAGNLSSTGSLVTVTTNLAINATASIGNSTVNAQIGWISGSQAIQQNFASDNNFIQVIIQNLSNGTNASGDLVINSDTANDTAGFIDLGINSKNYSNASFSITDPGEGYLYVANSGLAIGTASAKPVKFFVGGTTSADEKMRLTSGGNVAIGATTADATLKVTGTANVTGNTTLANNLIVGGNTNIGVNANVGGTLGVVGAANVGGALGIAGATTVSNNLIVTGYANVSGAANVSGTLSVTGNTALANNLTVGGNVGITVNANVGGTIGVVGAATLSNTLAVTGNATLSNTLAVTGNVTLSNTLAVTGNVSLSNTIAVTGNATFSNTIAVTGNVTLSNTLAVTGAATLSNNLTVSGVTNVATLNSSGLANLNNMNTNVANVTNVNITTLATIGTINSSSVGIAANSTLFYLGNTSVFSSITINGVSGSNLVAADTIRIGSVGSSNGYLSNTTNIVIGNSTVNTVITSSNLTTNTIYAYNFFVTGTIVGAFSANGNILPYSNDSIYIGVSSNVFSQIYVTNVFSNAIYSFSGNLSIKDNTNFEKMLMINNIQHFFANSFSYSVNAISTIDTFNATTYRSAEYTVQATDTATNAYYMSKLLVMHDGATAYAVEYGAASNLGNIVTFSADINSGNVRLRGTPTSNTITVKFSRQTITV